MVDVIGEVFPFAPIVALSPIPVIAIVLTLRSPDAGLPAWMATIDTVTPWRAVGFGLLLSAASRTVRLLDRRSTRLHNASQRTTNRFEPDGERQMNAMTEYRYNRLTWAEINDAIAAEQVVILPTGSTEQHGRHLPLDVDLFLAESVCLEVGKRAADRVLVLPPIAYGLNLHHIDFPGTIHIEPDVFIEFCVNITKSVAYHGFTKILVVNGHGSNAPLIDLVARRTVLETEALCVAVTYIGLALDAFNAVKDTPVVAHADEFETSLYLHLDASRVQMDLAGADDDVMGAYFSSDSTSNVRFNDYWGRWTELGVHGDARTATAAKGEVILEAAVAKLIGIVDELRAWPIADRADLHARPASKGIRW